MAKRRRLTPAEPGYADPAPAPSPSPARTPGLPPIAHVAGDAAARAALAAVSEELRAARETGRMVLSLPLASVAEAHLIRDRIAADPDDLAALEASLAARGQQTPIEVVDLGPGAGVQRFGLISGWRRFLALRNLHERTGDPAFAEVQALLRPAAEGAEAYVAMVEENEIRADLSFYERARIVMRAVEAGVYPTQKKALQGLFSTALPARRSKIKSFIPVVAALDGALRFPARIPERLGLALSRALEARPALAATLTARLQAEAPQTAEEEAALLQAALRPRRDPEKIPETDSVIAGSVSEPAVSAAPAPARDTLSAPFLIAPGIRIRYGKGPDGPRIEIEGPGLTGGVIERLQSLLRAR